MRPISNMQMAYRVYLLKRVAQEKVDPAGSQLFFEEVRAALKRHAQISYPNEAQQAGVLAEIDVAVAHVSELIQVPGLDIDEAVISAQKQLEDARREENSREQTSAPVETSEPRAQPSSSPTPLTYKASHVAATASAAAAAKDAVANARQRQGAGLVPVILAAVLSGAIAGAATTYLLRERPMASNATLVGEWRWMNATKIEFAQDGSVRVNDQPGSYYFATTHSNYVVVHGDGRFVDFITVLPDRRQIRGHNLAGDRITATRTR